ncbi:MAG: hypothetical protein ACW98F_19105 [Candidatus Hodarchaeales archaeon]
MSWEEIDKLLVKIFDSQVRKLKNRQTPSELTTRTTELPSSEFKGWLSEFIQDGSDYEEFEKSRLICKFCGEKIDNADFIVLSHPEYPDDFTRQLYFHCTSRCNPRIRYLEITRKMWLIRYNLERNLKNP